MGRPREVVDLAQERSRIRDALALVPSEERELWVRIGMAVKSALGEEGFELWDEWSRRAESYREPDARAVWRSIDPKGGITLGTLFFEARKYGNVRRVPIASARVRTSPSTSAPREGGGGVIPPVQQCNRATLAAYAEMKRLPEAFLRSLGLTDIRYRDAPALRIPYRDRSGAEVAVRIRRNLEKAAGHDQRFAWRRGDTPQLYGLDRLGLDEPMPESVSILPPPEVLHGCSVARGV